MTSAAPSRANVKLVYLVVGIAVGFVLGAVLPGVFTAVSTHPSTTSSGGGSSPPTPSTSVCKLPPPAEKLRVVGCSGVVADSSTVVTPAFNVTTGSLLLVFVSYVNAEIGGGYPQLVTDALGDTFLAITSTGTSLNHTEALYAAAPPSSDARFTVSVSFSGGATPQGGSVAAVDVANATVDSIEAVVPNFGFSAPAMVSVLAKHAGDLFLLGAAGRGMSGPYSAASGENLLDTGTATAGPFDDGVAYGTFETATNSTEVTLSANLSTSTYWEAIGVAIAPGSSSPPPSGLPEIAGHAGTVSNATPVTVRLMSVAPGSLILLFVSYVNSEIGGGAPSVVTDSLGDSYYVVATTGFAFNHTEELLVAFPTAGDTALAISVTFSGGATPMGGSVDAVDVTNATLRSIDAVVASTGSSGPANVTLVSNHAGDLVLFGVAGRGVAGPFTPGPGMTLLDTGTATAGPFQDGVAYGTFNTTSTSTRVSLSADLNFPTYWEAIGIAIDPSTA